MDKIDWYLKGCVKSELRSRRRERWIWISIVVTVTKEKSCKCYSPNNINNCVWDVVEMIFSGEEWCGVKGDQKIR